MIYKWNSRFNKTKWCDRERLHNLHCDKYRTNIGLRTI